jgi:hypothetical protein
MRHTIFADFISLTFAPLNRLWIMVQCILLLKWCQKWRTLHISPCVTQCGGVSFYFHSSLVRDAKRQIKTRGWTCFISQAQQSRELTEINGRAPPY